MEGVRDLTVHSRRKGGAWQKPAAPLLERIAILTLSSLDHPRPALAGISFSHMIIPVVASGDIALIPAICSPAVPGMLAVVPKVVVEYAVS